MYRVLVCLTLLGACVAQNGDEGILILKNAAPDNMCALTAMENEPFLSHGYLDVTIGAPYFFNAQVKSKITAAMGQEDQRTVILQGANVDISFPDSSLFSAAELQQLHDQSLTHFRALFSAPLAPNGGITDVTFTLVPGALATMVGQKAGTASVEALAAFTIDGQMADGTVTSQLFDYPITFAHLATVVGTCPLPAGTTIRTGNTCAIAQDAAVDCCTEASGQLLCPATVATM